MKVNKTSTNIYQNRSLKKILKMSTMSITTADTKMSTIIEAPPLMSIFPPSNPSVLYLFFSFHNKIKSRFFHKSP